MDRRKFLIGLGSAGIGGSALIGSSAFSRVEAHRSMTIQTAEDPDAYLGMDKCGDPPTPNSSYASIDEDGHLQVLMNPENPTIGDSPLGEGINSDSRSFFDNVFQITNQGKEPACVYIQDDDEWPTVPEGEKDAGERRVDFYLGGTREESLIGEDNAIALGLGETVCVGIVTRSFGLSEGDELLGAFENMIRVVADTEGDCFEETIPEVPFYGTSRSDPTGIFSIRGGGGTGIAENQIGMITDDSANSNYPNGVAYDPGDEVWYFAEEGGILKTLNEDGSLVEKVYGSVAGGSSIAGAAFFAGEYHFIPQDGDTLQAVDVQSDANYGTSDPPASNASASSVASLNWTLIGLGDLAVDRTSQILYVSTTKTQESGSNFFSVDLNNTGNQTEIASEADGSRAELAIFKQIAFDQDDRLWAHDATNGEWRIVDLTDGSLSSVVSTTREYTDLAQSGANSVE